MDVSVIQVPTNAGDDRHPSSAGPRRLLDAGAIDLLAAQDIAAASNSSGEVARSATV
jgi:hypothetical protein